MALHPRTSIYCIAKDAIPRVTRSDNACDERTGMNAYSNLDSSHGRITHKDRRLSSCLEGTESKISDALGVVVLLVLDKIRHSNKGVANGFDSVAILMERIEFNC